MPFPLAHPVAVLPFRRWCPRVLSFVGLVVGSVTPDLGYAFHSFDLSPFSHSLAGSVVFCLPAGILAACVVLALRRPLAGTLPAPHRQALEPICGGPWPAWWRLGLSVLMGVWTHLVFDALTHGDKIVEWPAHTLTGGVSQKRLWWIAASLLSLLVLGVYYLRFLKRTTGRMRLLDPADRRGLGLWGALLITPYLLIAPSCFLLFEPGGPVINLRTVYRSFMPYLLLATAAVTAVGAVLWLRQRITKGPATTSSDTPAPRA